MKTAILFSMTAVAALSACATGQFGQARPAADVAASAPRASRGGPSSDLGEVVVARGPRALVSPAPAGDVLAGPTLGEIEAAYLGISEEIRSIRARREAIERQLDAGETAAPAAVSDSAAAVAPDAAPAGLSEAERTLVSRRVYFRTNSDRLTPAAQQRLVEKLEILRAHPDLSMEIIGHADARGDSAYNQRLSERRAEAARKFLLARGVEADRVVATGRGSSEPAVEGTGAIVWRQNRRVDFNSSR